jgi:hypothetical protein
MTAENFLIDKWNSCVCMTHEDEPNSIVMVYDPIFIRQKKLNSLFDSNKDITFYKTEESKVYFVQNYENIFFYVDYEEIWLVLEDKYRLKYVDIQSLIKTVLLEGDKLKSFTPFHYLSHKILLLLEGDKLKSFTPKPSFSPLRIALLEGDKLKSFTPKHKNGK